MPEFRHALFPVADIRTPPVWLLNVRLMPVRLMPVRLMPVRLMPARLMHAPGNPFELKQKKVIKKLN